MHSHEGFHHAFAYASDRSRWRFIGWICILRLPLHSFLFDLHVMLWYTKCVLTSTVESVGPIIEYGSRKRNHHEELEFNHSVRQIAGSKTTKSNLKYKCVGHNVIYCHEWHTVACVCDISHRVHRMCILQQPHVAFRRQSVKMQNGSYEPQMQFPFINIRIALSLVGLGCRDTGAPLPWDNHTWIVNAALRPPLHYKWAHPSHLDPPGWRWPISFSATPIICPSGRNLTLANVGYSTLCCSQKTDILVSGR